MNTNQPNQAMAPAPLRRLTLLLLGSTLFPPALLHASTPAAPALPLAQNYHDQFDPSQYLVSEKLDGVRAVWDGSVLRFRSGKLIHAPAWFIAALPNHALDGELWLGRQSFERLSAAVRRQQALDEEWKNIRYQLYELPNGTGSFAERVAALQAFVAQAAKPWLQVVAQERVANLAALKQKLAQVVQHGGEGLMLRQPASRYVAGRSSSLLKVKRGRMTPEFVIADKLSDELL